MRPDNNCDKCSYWLALNEPETTAVEHENILEHCLQCRIDNFLNGLSELTKTYGIEIGGCGCCGSPFLVDTDSCKFVGDNLDYDREAQKYDTD